MGGRGGSALVAILVIAEYVVRLSPFVHILIIWAVGPSPNGGILEASNCLV